MSPVYSNRMLKGVGPIRVLLMTTDTNKIMNMVTIINFIVQALLEISDLLHEVLYLNGDQPVGFCSLHFQRGSELVCCLLVGMTISNKLHDPTDHSFQVTEAGEQIERFHGLH